MRRGLGCLADRSGASAVEYALLLPALLILLLGIADMADLAWNQASIDFAVDAAARCAAIDSSDCGTTAQIQSYAAAHAYALNLPSSRFLATAPACGAQVSASVPFSFVTPWVAPQQITLTASACYPINP